MQICDALTFQQRFKLLNLFHVICASACIHRWKITVSDRLFCIILATTRRYLVSLGECLVCLLSLPDGTLCLWLRICYQMNVFGCIYDLVIMFFYVAGDHVIVGSYDRKLAWFDLDLSTKPYQALK